MRAFLHVARPEDWEAAQAGGAYAIPGAGDGATFLHGCFPEQLDGVLDRFYPGDHVGLLVLTVSPEGLPVRVEAATDGAGDFPHLYGPLPVASVTDVRVLGS